ncbi:1,4-dihydroxy-2-naphthoate polyprenyltransferase [Lentibacillus halophilus]|uniref:1,4-dihydroxy-2-naphthoate polyprenyltransferase n=1 Tax=Lentibacillus halophilus TaxID=295065 RepID=A0ABP3J9L6_9BACI
MMSSAVNDNQPIYYYRASWLQLLRPMTLTGTVTPILAGTGIAAANGTIQPDLFLAMLAAALLVQSATNLFNDYYDFLHGQDKPKWTTDIVHAKGPSHHAVLYIGVAMLVIAMSIGGWLATQSTWWILPVGMAGILFGYLYSAGPRPLCSIGLGETVAFTFLGPVVTILSYVVQGNRMDVPIIAISLPFAWLIASMILTNNIRDIEKDGPFRRTLATILGRARAVRLLMVVLVLPYVTVIILMTAGFLPVSSTIVLCATPLAIKLLWSFRSHAERTDERSGMKWAAWHHWAFGLLMVIGIWV